MQIERSEQKASIHSPSGCLQESHSKQPKASGELIQVKPRKVTLAWAHREEGDTDRNVSKYSLREDWCVFSFCGRQVQIAFIFN